MKIAVVSSHTTSLFWFRMDMMRDFMRKGYEVIAIGSDEEQVWADKFKKEGIKYIKINVSRNGLNPLGDIETYKNLKSIFKSEKPDKIFLYQAKTVVYGCLAAKANNIVDVFPMVTGLGSVFRGVGYKNRVVKAIMSKLYKKAFKWSKSIIFQNIDDKNELIAQGLLSDDKCRIVNGSGVNLDLFTPSEVNTTVPTLLYVGRLTRDKGVYEYIEACRIIKQMGIKARCLLIGPFDTNPSSLNMDDLNPYIEGGVIEYLGELSDVKPYLDICTTYILPSYHEGTPKSVLEAMAKGRAIITSDAPGCRETVIDGVNGFLVKPKDIDTLVNKIIYLIENPNVNVNMGMESLKMVRAKYDVKIVNSSIMNIMEI